MTDKTLSEPSATPEPLGFKALFRLFLRTWPYLKPNAHHIGIWVLLQIVSLMAVSLTAVMIYDILNNKIFIGGALEPAQAALLLLDESYVGAESLTDAQRLTVRNRLGFLTAVGVFLNTLVLQIAVLNYYYTWITQRINQQLRVRMIENAEYLSLRYHSHARTGDAIYRIYQDSATITAVIDNVILDPINIGSKFLLALIIVWLFNPWLGLVAIGASIPIVWLVLWYTPRLQRLSQKARQSSSDLTSNIQEAFASIRVIKANGAEPLVGARFDHHSRVALDAALRLRLEMVTMWAIVAIIGGVSIAAADYFMADWTISAEATWLAGAVTLVGFAAWNLGAFQVASTRNQEFFDWSRGLITKWSFMQDMAVGLDRAFFLLDLEPEVADPQTPVPFPEDLRHIVYKDVVFGYDEHQRVLNGVNLTAERGTITAIVGHTGSGKSTLMSLLLRLYDPSSGSITLNGIDLQSLAIADIRTHTAIALQQNVLFATSVADNICYGTQGKSQAEIESAAAIACADEFIRELPDGYDTELGERGGKLSTGQRERLSIARAIVRDTPILILDEPTASLDAETEGRLLSNLASWGRNRIVFLITHRLSTIRGADQIAFLQDGVIKELGDHATLMSDPDGCYRQFVDAELGPTNVAHEAQSSE